jgi:hypothetical protein
MPSASEVLLAQFRMVERQLAAMPGDSPEAEVLRREAERLRWEYEEIVALVLDHHSPEEFLEPQAAN